MIFFQNAIHSALSYIELLPIFIYGRFRFPREDGTCFISVSYLSWTAEGASGFQGLGPENGVFASGGKGFGLRHGRA